MTQQYVNRYDNRDCSGIDYRATTLFLQMCKDKGWNYRKATRDQDMFEHWDWRITKEGTSHLVDIKGLKKINSKDTTPDDSLLCVEFENVEGNIGWLQGQADFIAFLVNEGFVFVNTKDLLELSLKKIDWEANPIPSPRHKKEHIVYQRSQWGQKDKFAYLRKEDVLSLKHALWRRNV